MQDGTRHRHCPKPRASHQRHQSDRTPRPSSVRRKKSDDEHTDRRCPRGADAFVDCEQNEKMRENKAKQAHAERLLQVQKGCNARTAELQKDLETEIWGRRNDYQLQREGREVRLKRRLEMVSWTKRGNALESIAF